MWGRSGEAMVAWVASALALGACGGGGPPPAQTVSASADAIDSRELLTEYGAEHTSLLREPEQSIEVLEDRMREARGSERLQIIRDVASAHMLAADEADDAGESREARRHRHKAERFVARALRWNRGRDKRLAAELDFVNLWTAWTGGKSRRAEAVGERFVTRRRDAAGELLALAWIVRAEAAFDDERWDDAAGAYRYVLGQLGHPLYAFALYRTAQCHRRQGREDDAREMLEEVVQLACKDSSETTMRVAERAAAETDTPLRVDTDGQRRPASCPRGAQPGAAASSGTEEKPPGLE